MEENSLVRGNIETYEKLIKSAKLEFSEKGFQNASIRSISSRAGMTIGALYQHFDNKESAFEQVVSPVYNGFLLLSENMKKNFITELNDKGQMAAGEIIADMTAVFTSYIFDNWELFLILISNDGTNIYRRFFQKIVANEVEMTMFLIENNYQMMTAEQLELIISAQYSGIFALMRSGNDKQQIEGNLRLLFKFFRGGWERLFTYETD